jgi:phage I-like protein
MTLEQLLAMLGVATADEAAAAINRFNAFLTSAKVATGKTGASEALDTLQASASFAKSIETALGVSGPAALAKIEGLKTAQENLQAVEARAKSAEKANFDRQASDAIDAATREGKLMPAARDKAEKMYASFGLEGLQTFLATLPVVGPVAHVNGASQPAPRASDALSLTDEERAIAKACGKTEADMLDAKKLWASEGGEISDAHTNSLNAKLKAVKAA